MICVDSSQFTCQGWHGLASRDTDAGRKPVRHVRTEELNALPFGMPLGKAIKDLISIVSPRTFARWIRQGSSVASSQGRPAACLTPPATSQGRLAACLTPPATSQGRLAACLTPPATSQAGRAAMFSIQGPCARAAPLAWRYRALNRARTKSELLAHRYRLRHRELRHSAFS
jgi:hypothetical protein